jgi:molybdopterin-binding protein
LPFPLGLAAVPQHFDTTSGVEMQCGPHRMVSLMSTEAARELGLAPGLLAVAVVNSTQVLIETNRTHPRLRVHEQVHARSRYSMINAPQGR